MIYKTFKQWKNGKFLEHFGPRKANYTQDEFDLIEMGWKYGYDAGIESTPPKREWVGLTDDEILEIPFLELVEGIQAKLKEKNT